MEDSGIWSLNHDALEEVASHCSVGTLLNLQQTCASFSQLLASSEKVWFRKLAEDFGLHLKALPSHDTVFVKLARTVYEAARTSPLRYQGVLVTGGVDEDAMQYWVDNLFKPGKAPYCSNCSYNADCMALLLDGEVPRDVEYERVRRYMVRRCRYAAALIMNVQLPQQDRDPDAVMDILEDWTDAQLESFFRDLVAALNQGHALGRLLVYDVEHDRIPTEQQRILAVERYLRDRLKAMKRGMLKPPQRPNTMLDSTVIEKLQDPERSSMAGVVHEVTLSRQGSLTCPVSSGVVFLGHMDYSRLAGLSAEQVALELEAATQDPVCTSFNFLATPEQVEAAAAAGRIPPIAVTDQTLSGIWHEFGPSAAPAAAAQQRPQRAAEPAAVVAGKQPTAGAAQQQAAGAAAPPPSPAAAPATAAAAAAAGPGPASGGAAQPSGAPPPHSLHPPFSPDAPPPSGTPLQGRLVRWRPLLWFHFHQYEECVEFVRSNHSLLAATAPAYGSVTVRHRGPPSTLPGSLHMPSFRAQQAAAAARRAAGGAPQAQPPPLWPAGHPAAAQAAGTSSSHAAAAAAAAAGMHPMLAAAHLPHHPMGLGHPPQPPPLPPHLHEVFLGALHAGALHPVAAPAAAAPAALAAAPAGLPGGAAPALAGQAGAAGFGGAEADDDASTHDSLMSDDEDMGGSSGGEVGEAFGEEDEEEPGGLGDDDAMPAGGHDLPAVGELEDDDADAGSENGSDDEEQHAQHVAAFYNAVAAAAVAAAHAPGRSEGGASSSGSGAGAGGGVAGGAAAGVVADPLARPSLGLVTKRSTRGRNKLRVTLSHPASGNVLLVKLVNQENLMHLFRDQHDWPNIDMAHVGLNGKVVQLPPGVSLAL